MRKLICAILFSSILAGTASACMIEVAPGGIIITRKCDEHLIADANNVTPSTEEENSAD